ncbi:fructose-1-phosphate kinase [Clostridium sp. CAG:411]|nr:1-phosphofructokinase [Lachnospiraceae bacterium]CDE44383.1 fructose-1-phosphate kinase [Clostridium sp. CAG:411]
MIYTVTFNPALDYIMRVPSLETDTVNRTDSESVFYGGKGINVSIILSRLEVPNVALGFIAGFTGREIQDGVKAQGVETKFIPLEQGLSRINVKIKNAEKKEETEINAQGPKIPEDKLQELYEQLEQLTADDMLVLAGSIPNTLPSDVYEQIMKRLQSKQVPIVVDATKDLLKNVLKYHPFLIKPNNFELGEMFGVTLHSKEEIVHYAKELQKLGARNVVVSMAGDGSILVTEDGEVHQMGVAKGTVKNSVGAGDSMVAGFVAGYIQKGDYAYALKLGTAAGGATAFSDDLATREKIQETLKSL